MAGLLGCSSDTATPGATLLSAIKHYQSEMASIGSSPERWPERQRTAGTFKTVVTVMMERPVEFNRMIDLDLKAKEFAVTMPTLAPESARIKEMTMEVGEMNRELAGLAERVRVQATMPVAAEDKVSAVATQGLLVIAVNSFVPANDSSANRSEQSENISLRISVRLPLCARPTVRCFSARLLTSARRTPVSVASRHRSCLHTVLLQQIVGQFDRFGPELGEHFFTGVFALLIFFHS